MNKKIVALKELSVLIIDDEEPITDVLSKCLSHKGLPFRTYTAASFQEAQAKLEAQNFDLVITDILLPDGKKGLDLVKEDQPFIVMTGQSEQQHLQEALDKGAIMFLRKPFSVLDIPQLCLHTVRLFNAIQDEKKYRKLWQSLAENVEDIITTIIQEGIISFINHSISGEDVSTVIGTNFLDFVLPKYRAELKHKINLVYEQKIPLSALFEGMGKHNETRWYECRIVPVIDHDTITHVNIISIDITDMKRAEEELKKANLDLAKKDAQFAQMATALQATVNNELETNKILIALSNRLSKEIAELESKHSDHVNDLLRTIAAQEERIAVLCSRLNEPDDL